MKDVITMTDLEKVAELVRLGAEPSFDNFICQKISCADCTFGRPYTLDAHINITLAKELLPQIKQVYPEYFI